MAKTVKINGITYETVPEVDIPLANGSGSAKFYGTDGDTGTAADVLAGKTVHGATGSITGTMTENGLAGVKVSTIDGATIPSGHYDGTGKAAIDTDEAAKIVSGNIKAGVTILGVAGSTSVVDTADATATAATVKTGVTAYVNGAKITGTMTAATVSQDTTTKIVTIQ